MGSYTVDLRGSAEPEHLASYSCLSEAGTELVALCVHEKMVISPKRKMKFVAWKAQAKRTVEIKSKSGLILPVLEVIKA